MASIKQITDRKYKITISNGYRTDGRKICKTKTIQVPDSVPKRGIEQYVYHEAERLERLFKQGYSEDDAMTFETYARGWLERQTKYAPYDRLLPTFARNRVPGVGGWAPISIILRSTPPQPPARCAVFHLHPLPAHIVPAQHPADLPPVWTIPRTRPWSSVRF